LTPLKSPEKSRTYVYTDGNSIVYENVVAVGVRESGSHRLELGDGRKVIVLPGFAAVELDVAEWTF
jgi:hypothetical protein